MSTDILCDLRDDQILPAVKLADLLNITRQGVGPYYAERDLRYSQLRTLMRLGGDRRITFAFLRDLLRDLPIVATEVAASADINGDGDVNVDDLLAGVAQQMQHLADEAEGVATVSGVNGRIDVATKRRLDDAIIEGRRCLDTMQMVVDHIAAATERRHGKRQTLVAGGVA